MITDRKTILASVAANGLRASGRNKWTDGRYEWTMVRQGNGYDLKCRCLVPVHNWNEEVRSALRPMFLEARSSGLV